MVEAIVVRNDEGVVNLAMDRWPDEAAFSDELVRDSDGMLVLHYPYLHVKLANARATYLVEACDLGTWRGNFLEGSIDPRR